MRLARSLSSILNPQSSIRRSRNWSGRRDSNPRPTAWKAVTLPTELLPPTQGRSQRAEGRRTRLVPSAFCLLTSAFNGGEWRIRTSVGRGPADLQSAAFDRSANSPFWVQAPGSRLAGFVPCSREPTADSRVTWSWRRDSNPRPADYKSAALPTELCQHECNDFKDTISLSGSRDRVPAAAAEELRVIAESQTCRK
jgi:hypothetical protein